MVGQLLFFLGTSAGWCWYLFFVIAVGRVLVYNDFNPCFVWRGQIRNSHSLAKKTFWPTDGGRHLRYGLPNIVGSSFALPYHSLHTCDRAWDWCVHVLSKSGFSVRYRGLGSWEEGTSEKFIPVNHSLYKTKKTTSSAQWLTWDACCDIIGLFSYTFWGPLPPLWLCTIPQPSISRILLENTTMVTVFRRHCFNGRPKCTTPIPYRRTRSGSGLGL